MAKVIAHMRVDSEIVAAVKEIAQDQHNGNFTAAVEDLIRQSLQMRSIEESYRWKMYEAAKSHLGHAKDSQTYTKFIRSILTSLHL